MTRYKSILRQFVIFSTSTTTTTGNKLKLIDWSEFSLKSGWNTLEDFGKRIAGLAALFVFGAMLMPIWTPGQDGLMRYQIEQNAERIASAEKRLDGIPTAMAVLSVKQETMSTKLDTVVTKVDGIETKFNGSILGAFLGLVIYLFKMFGGKMFGVREETT